MPGILPWDESPDCRYWPCAPSKCAELTKKKYSKKSIQLWINTWINVSFSISVSGQMAPVQVFRVQSGSGHYRTSPTKQVHLIIPESTRTTFFPCISTPNIGHQCAEHQFKSWPAHFKP